MKKLFLLILFFCPIVFAQQPVQGTKTNNNAVPGATNLGVLPCVANASAPSFSEGDMVTCSVDLSGNLRVLLAANQSVNMAQVGGTAVVANPCQQAIPTVVAISQTANTKVISATSAKKNYICSILIIATAAEIPSIIEGTGSTCGTGTAAVAGSTTSANGMSLVANGGFAIGNGAAAVIPGISTNVDTCLFQNGSNRLSGFLSYVQE